MIGKLSPPELARLLVENADEPQAAALGAGLAGRSLATTKDLVNAIRRVLPGITLGENALTARRVFQALRIAVNDEFSALATLLVHLPRVLNPGGRVAILTFHSGEDRRVKKAFAAGLRDGVYAEVSEVLRAGAEERVRQQRDAVDDALTMRVLAEADDEAVDVENHWF